MPTIHPTAIVDPAAELAADVRVGPFAMIEADVCVGAGTVVHARAHLGRGTVLGCHNVVHIGAVLGRVGAQMDPGLAGVGLIAGDRNEFRENASILRGTAAAPTRIGDENYVMGGARLGAGVTLGHRTTVAAVVVLAQNVRVDDSAFISGNVVVHQGVRIGRLAFVSGLSAVYRDAPPFMTVGGRPSVTIAPNMIGMRRAGIPSATREAIKRAYKRLFRPEVPPEDALAEFEGPDATAEEHELIAFLRERHGVRTAVEDQLIV